MIPLGPLLSLAYALLPIFHLEASPSRCTTPQGCEGEDLAQSLEVNVGWRVVPGPPWASSSILDQKPPDSQMLRLDETMDVIGDDDPFTAKLSFEVRHLKSGKVLRGLVESHQYFPQTLRVPQLMWQWERELESFLW